jgi:hypothetical protein
MFPAGPMMRMSFQFAAATAALFTALAACTPLPPPPPPEAFPVKSTAQPPAIPKNSPVTPELVATLLGAQPPVALVSALSNTALSDGKTQLDIVFAGIESGNEAWLRVAPNLKLGLDGGNGTRMKLALGKALAANASGVLKVLGGPLPVAEYCASSLIEPTPAALKAYRDDATKALEGVTDLTLAEKKTACLAAVKG